jgi:glycosyltransferase involved in cell wall biosynthesis
MQPIPLSVLIITYNEELHIEHCIKSVQEWSSQIFVVDSFSTDRTVEIATRMGATVVSHEFRYPAQQKNWALQNLRFENEWLLLLDADERVPAVLRDEITRVVTEDSKKYDGYWMRYRFIFYDRWIKHCGWYPSWYLRLVRQPKTRFEDRTVDEHAIVSGPVGYLENDLLHQSLQDMTAWIAKHNKYSSQNARIYFDLSQKGERADLVPPRLFGTQAERKRFIKERIWPHLPGRAILYFFYMYVFRLGFLDGRQGFIFCYMHAIFQQFNIVKLWELQRATEADHDEG